MKPWKVIVYTIMKNEKHNILAWLENIKEADGIYVLDTGSTDGSYELMCDMRSQFPQLVIEQKTYDTFQFDVARNDNLAMVPNENNIVCWTIDLDERFEEGWYEETLSCAEKYPQFYKLQYWYACKHDEFGNVADKHIYDKCHRRLGANWSRPIHEIMTYGEYESIYTDGLIMMSGHDILVHHYQNEHERRSDQYMNLLKQRIKNDKYDIEAFHHLTTEYGKLGDIQSQLDLMLLQYGRGLMCNCDWMECICGNLAETYQLLNMPPEAHMWYQRAIQFNPKLRTYYIKYIEFLLKQNLFHDAFNIFRNLEVAQTYPQEEWKEIDDLECNSILALLFDAWAVVLYYKEDFDNAYDFSLRATQLNPYDERIAQNFIFCKQKKTEGKVYITVLSDNSFINGVVALHKSLNEVNSIYPLCCIVTPEVTEENLNVLRQLDINIIEKNPNYYSEKTNEMIQIIETLDTYGWHKAMVKLELFNLTQFKKLVYLDSDMIVHQNIDELFCKPHMSAARDCYDINGYFGNGQTFNSGLMVIEPNEEEYNNIIKHLKTFNSSEQLVHDQLVLQTYFTEWPHDNQLLEPIYNYWSTYADTSEPIKVTHFVDKKPWRETVDYFKQFQQGYPRYVQMSLWYIDYINETIAQLKEKNIYSSDLQYIY